MTFPRSTYSWAGAAEHLEKVQSPETLKNFRQQTGEIKTFDTHYVFLDFLNKNKCRLMIQKLTFGKKTCVLAH